MVTKKQHYYPRTLIKHFANEDEKLYTYIRMCNKIHYVNYKTVCAENYTYEGSSGVDNILEKKLSLLEDKLAPIVDKIINTKIEKLESVVEKLSKKEIDFLYKYVKIQKIRTDSGRIWFIRSSRNSKYIPRRYPYEFEELKKSKTREIQEFNDRFKQDSRLENLVEFFKKPSYMNFHVIIGNNFITSDNPVIVLDEGMQLYLPISPKYCIAFQHNYLNCSKKIIVNMTLEKNQYINEAQIETSNYYIMSKKNFDFITNWYIYKRFHEKNWGIKSKHFK